MRPEENAWSMRNEERWGGQAGEGNWFLDKNSPRASKRGIKKEGKDTLPVTGNDAGSITSVRMARRKDNTKRGGWPIRNACNLNTKIEMD